ncbi:MAG: chloride channel protein [Rhodospirillales bacterium]|nr:chloride channel protein [Rhodospirillales bacterium]
MPQSRLTYGHIQSAFRKAIRNEHLLLVGLGLVVGCVAGAAVIVFREAIELIELSTFGITTNMLARYELTVASWKLILIPAAGGLIVGLVTWKLMPGGQAQGVADVVEASAMRAGQMSSRVGIVSAFCSAVSVGAGASVGREGPAVHLGASLAGWIARRLHLSRSLSRTLLGCGVAAAVSASFNAPIAGALFATEVVVGQYALKTFAPIVVASVAGTALSHIHFGEVSAFLLGDNYIASFWEFPAFIGLGVVAAVAAIVLMQSIFWAQDMSPKVKLPIWAKPAVAGAIVGVIAIWLPQVMSVGYGFVEWAILGQFEVKLLIAIGIAKVFATALCLGFGFSGGVFSPALVLGAAVGSSYGLIAADVFPALASGVGVYTVVGMGAVAAAVLGAPISTTLIIFEITGDYKLSLAVMLAIVVSTELTHHLFGASFFAETLRRRNVDLRDGFEAEVLDTIKVRHILDHGTNVAAETISMETPITEVREKLSASTTGELFVVQPTGELYGTITLQDCGATLFDNECSDLLRAADLARLHPPILNEGDNLGAAMRIMRESGEDHIAVLRDPHTKVFTGCVHHRDVMTAYNRALLKVRHDEHNQ